MKRPMVPIVQKIFFSGIESAIMWPGRDRYFYLTVPVWNVALCPAGSLRYLPTALTDRQFADVTALFPGLVCILLFFLAEVIVPLLQPAARNPCVPPVQQPGIPEVACFVLLYPAIDYAGLVCADSLNRYWRQCERARRLA